MRLVAILAYDPPKRMKFSLQVLFVVPLQEMEIVYCSLYNIETPANHDEWSFRAVKKSRNDCCALC